MSIKILKGPVPIEDRPGSIRLIPGHKFYQENAELIGITKFGRHEEAGHYSNILNGLAMDINELIGKLN